MTEPVLNDFTLVSSLSIMSVSCTCISPENLFGFAAANTSQTDCSKHFTNMSLCTPTLWSRYHYLRPSLHRRMLGVQKLARGHTGNGNWEHRPTDFQVYLITTLSDMLTRAPEVVLVVKRSSFYCWVIYEMADKKHFIKSEGNCITSSRDCFAYVLPDYEGPIWHIHSLWSLSQCLVL